MHWPQIRRALPAPLFFTAVFAVAFLIFFVFQFTTTFADPDSFYHVKMALLIRDHGIVQDFPWLPFTTLADSYIDQHLLYHFLLIPFTLVGDPIVGGKLATVVLAAGTVTVFAWVLRRLHVWAPALWVAVLLATNPFVFRVSLAKTSALSLIILFLAFWLLVSYRHRWLLVVSFGYVWTYGGFALLPLIATVYAVVALVLDAFRRRRWVPWAWLMGVVNPSSRRSRWFRPLTLQPVRAWGAVLLGTVAGVVLHPSFPTNLTFYWHQLVQIGIINYRDTIGVGGEWYAYAFLDLLANNVFVTIALVLGLVLFLIHFRRQTRVSTTLLILAVFFFMLTLRSRRFVEYYVPFAMLFGAYVITLTRPAVDWRSIRQQLRDFTRERRIVTALIVGYLLIAVPTIVVRDMVSNRRSFEQGFPITKFKSAMTWLRAVSRPGDIVFHSDWDEFPILFYYNDQNRYIAGLDPTFLYVADPDRYWAWVNVTTGAGVPDLLGTLQQAFGASYVFLEKDHTAMDALVRAEPKLKLIYEDAEAKIYRVPPP
ncbi:MAG: hypothetical protein HY341_01940 [Candidatus Kerfeldbacteria bacterium]|nr:hypothetical protein [Candidatus Kerfeldbacteria bacterium]